MADQSEVEKREEERLQKSMNRRSSSAAALGRKPSSSNFATPTPAPAPAPTPSASAAKSTNRKSAAIEDPEKLAEFLKHQQQLEEERKKQDEFENRLLRDAKYALNANELPRTPSGHTHNDSETPVPAIQTTKAEPALDDEVAKKEEERLMRSLGRVVKH